MLTVQNLAYTHPDREVLFDNINFSLQNHTKAALVGSNGSGKSTLLKVIAGALQSSDGSVTFDSKPYYVPQHFGQFDDVSVAEALRVDVKLNALHAILSGDLSNDHYSQLNDDWTIEDRCRDALAFWSLRDVSLDMKMGLLSGGEKSKVFLAGIAIHQPELVLLDEPSNHLDSSGRNLLYRFITSSNCSFLTISHDRTLLDLLNPIYELDKRGLTVYGGSYSFYKEQKEAEVRGCVQQVEVKEKALHKAKQIQREAMERKQKQDARGRKKQDKEGMPRIFLKTLKNNAESSSAKLKDAHAQKIMSISEELSSARKRVMETRMMKLDLESSRLHAGKMLLDVQSINFGYDDRLLWTSSLTFQVRCGERICIRGSNGSGKTTLVKILMGSIRPTCGSVSCAVFKSVYFDQDYSLIDDASSVYEQVQRHNTGALPESEVKTRLSRYLFDKSFWDQPCSALSGGEKMRLMLCCLMVNDYTPDLLILDEPTNNLDIQNVEILTSAIRQYNGTLLVITHDEYFLNDIGVEREIVLE